MSNLFKAQAYNNAWSNFRLLSACRQLSAAELSAERTSFFPSIIATLNHILIVDWFYVSGLEGDCIGPAAFVDLIPCPDLAHLIDEQTAIDRRFIAVASDPQRAVADRSIEMPRRDRVQIERFDRAFLNLVQHQIHHRGQVHAMLSGTSVKPPQLDEFYPASQPDKDLRKPDFDAMGITEQDVWEE